MGQRTEPSTLLGSCCGSTSIGTPYAVPPTNPFVDDSTARAGNLGLGSRNPVAFFLRPGDRGSLHCRRRTKRVGRSKLRTGRPSGWAKLRLERDGRDPLLPGVRQLQPRRTGASRHRVQSPGDRRLFHYRRLRIPGGRRFLPFTAATCSATTAAGRSGWPTRSGGSLWEMTSLLRTGTADQLLR